MQDTESPKKKQSPGDFLSQHGGPNDSQLESWKAQTCNGRLQLFCPDQRIYIMRSISGLEMKELQAKAANMGAKDPEAEYQLMAICAACLWTNTSADKRLSPELLRAGSAGLPVSLFAIVANLSDFYEPFQLDQMIVEI